MLRARLFTNYIARNQLLFENTSFQNTVKVASSLDYRHHGTNFAHRLKEAAVTLKTHDEKNVKISQTKNLTEQQFLVRLKNDPDKFGPPQEKEVFDEGDIKEEEYFTQQPNASQKLRTKQYADIIKKLISQRKIKEAIDVVEVRMLKEDRVKPENYLYNLLLGACGRVGYTKKAFMIYNTMKKRGLTVTGGTYTALFNACANSPWLTTDGLSRATHLRNIMIEKGYEPNETNYNAMIKAFGRCGDLPMAFSLVDEMRSKKFKIKDETINFLIQACISDKEAGFRHALLVWRKLVNKRIAPNIYTYNLMLRCIRECGLGDVEVTQDVINRIISSGSNTRLIQKENSGLESSEQKLLSTSDENDVGNQSSENTQEKNTSNEGGEILEEQNSHLMATVTTPAVKVDSIRCRPNLMADTPHLGNIISLSEITKPEERLLLVGGSNGFLENMKQYGCTPDIKTFTELLDCIPNTVAAENDLLVALRKSNTIPDVGFYNMLIKKRSMRFDYEGGRMVLISMQQQKLRPDLITYGVLALGCRTREECLELIGEMKAASYRLNVEILGAMLCQACYHLNVPFVMELMQLCIEENVQPNKKFLETLVQFKKRCKYSKDLTKPQEKEYIKFKKRYKTWLQEVTVDESEDMHPWQQYRQTSEGSPRYKWKDGARFKPKHTSKFKVKTSFKNKN